MNINNLIAAGESGDPAYEPRGYGGLADWVTIVPNEFSLASGEALEIDYTISVPKSASAGGYAATIFAAATSSDTVAGGTGSRVGAMVGANLLVNISGDIVEQASVAEFSTAQARLAAGEPLEFTVRVQNSGNSNIKPTGLIELFRKGTKVLELPVNAENGTILPGSIRKFSVGTDEKLASGSYTALLTVSYGAGQILTTPELAFTVVAGSQLLIGAVILLALLLGIVGATLLFGRKRLKIK